MSGTRPAHPVCIHGFTTTPFPLPSLHYQSISAALVLHHFLCTLYFMQNTSFDQLECVDGLQDIVLCLRIELDVKPANETRERSIMVH
jgi:hypothetical protein